MATSVLMASEEVTRKESEQNFGGFEESRPENTKQNGRRKSKSNEAAQKKKQPQRGMGVAQLERLRLQEGWKKMTETTVDPLRSLNPYFLPTASFPDPTPASVPAPFPKFGGYDAAPNGMGVQLGLNQALLLQRLGNGGFSGQVGGYGVGGGVFQADPYGLGAPNLSLKTGNVAETSKELSSMPNMSLSSYSDHCGLCHKKKRVNGENLECNGMRDKYGDLSPINGCSFLRTNLRNRQNIDGENQGLGMMRDVDQEVEVVAVHRKGSSGGGGSVFMEFEFFPGKVGRGTSSKEYLDLVGFSSSEAASVAAGAVGGADPGSCFSTSASAPTTSTTTAFDASPSSSISVDLSLKLSY